MRMSAIVKLLLLVVPFLPAVTFAQTVSFKNIPFVFGLATAPAHSEDQLDDAWLEFARNGGVAAWKNADNPEQRLRFWSDPETELNWAQASGVKSLRIGLDWSRLVPHRPAIMQCGPEAPCADGIQDRSAVLRYRQILRMIRGRGIEPVVTLFHHSMPRWAVEKGGWSNPEVTESFVKFSEDAVREFGDLVDEWITFNEPTVYALLSDVAGMWPPGGKQRLGGLISVPLIVRGAYWLSLENMASAHNRIFDFIHAKDLFRASATNPFPHKKPARVGLAHNISYNNGASWMDWPSARYFDSISKYVFTDRIAGKLDFLGINYYGQEVVKGLGAAFVDRAEYSESGRGVFPAGLALLLIDYHERYNRQKVSRGKAVEELKFVVTENGISDSTDVLRGTYLVEHLAAVEAALQAGVPVEGYFFWTLSDNWEWADGYCPKFGLLEVDRLNELHRIPRPSFYLFRSIVHSREISAATRDRQWQFYLSQSGIPRPQCRAPNGKDPLDEPRFDMNFRGIDFRFRRDQLK
ncbi:MAG: glycoside hydrolase family 1 protein [Proteobacteria bacterium]|nr:glycoside hydrolase family 1 protein [Pseudomonadota bacterium]